MAFFAPHRGYAVGNEPGCQVREFKQMVRAMHQAGIEVILDVVFNHTAEGNDEGPTFSFKGLENRVYYMLNADGYVQELLGLRQHAQRQPPDRPRVDLPLPAPLGPQLSRRRLPVRSGVDSQPRPHGLFGAQSAGGRGRSAKTRCLADTKIIAEAWDAAGAYQVGTFGQLRWAEWNGRYRDDMRRFWRGDPHMVGALATRLAGSSDLYQPGGRRPYHSINFITSHDGFTLNDLVSYNEKHNEANGEDNRDGDNNNYSYNYGVEGPTRRRSIEQIRVRQIKNMLASLLLSQGVPMILAGDECRRTQRGNNNAYCQDNAISWFDWRLAEKNEPLRRFCQALIEFRRAEPTVRQTNFLCGQPFRPGGLPDVSWYSADGGPVDWEQNDASLVCLLAAVPRKNNVPRPNHHVLLLCHAGPEPRRFVLPEVARTIAWRTFLDTAGRVAARHLPGPRRPAAAEGRRRRHRVPVDACVSSRRIRGSYFGNMPRPRIQSTHWAGQFAVPGWPAARPSRAGRAGRCATRPARRPDAGPDRTGRCSPAARPCPRPC